MSGTLAPAKIIAAVTSIINDIHSDEEVQIPLGVSRLGSLAQIKEARMARQRRSETGRPDGDFSPPRASRSRQRDDTPENYIRKRSKPSMALSLSDSEEDVDYTSSVFTPRRSSLQSSSSSALSSVPTSTKKLQCDACKHLNAHFANFCQNCGARMENTNFGYSSDN